MGKRIGERKQKKSARELEAEGERERETESDKLQEFADVKRQDAEKQ